MRVSVRNSVLVMAAFGAFALAGAPGEAGATTINFDDIPNANGGPIGVYEGLSWYDFDALNVVDFTAYNGPNGYSNGDVSAPNVALNDGGFAAFSSASTFTLNDFYLTAAWKDGLNVEITGLLGFTPVDSITEVIGTSGPTHVVLGWTGIDRVEFVTSGGVDHGYVDKSGVAGGQFALDNVTINGAAVPEPATWATLMLGLGLIGVDARRRRARAAPAG